MERLWVAATRHRDGHWQLVRWQPWAAPDSVTVLSEGSSLVSGAQLVGRYAAVRLRRVGRAAGLPLERFDSRPRRHGGATRCPLARGAPGRADRLHVPAVRWVDADERADPDRLEPRQGAARGTVRQRASRARARDGLHGLALPRAALLASGVLRCRALGAVRGRRDCRHRRARAVVVRRDRHGVGVAGTAPR